jgi:SsrA-binding protein
MNKKKNTPVEIKNKKAEFEYFLESRFTAGIVLTGAEVKSIRSGHVNLNDAFCLLIDTSILIRNLHISEFKNAGYVAQDPMRDKVLLLSKKEIAKIKVKMKEKGYALIPVRLFFSENGFVKIEIALGKGKKLYDKRDDLKEKDIKREMERFQ